MSAAKLRLAAACGLLLSGGGVAWNGAGATEDREPLAYAEPVEQVAATFGQPEADEPEVVDHSSSVAVPVKSSVADPVEAQTPATGGDANVYTPAELDELVGPIALYPDDLLGIVLPASAYPLQLVEAQRFLEQSKDGVKREPDADWDDSVVAMLNYPEALKLLNDDLDWTWRLGDAVINQQADVMSAVSRFRDRAYAAGNLKSDERQIVRETEDDVIEIVPADPEVIYVPYYEPERVVVYQPWPAYYYYPRAYPLYYYPYPVDYYFPGAHFFWGVTTVFALHWHSHALHVHDYWHHHHPYYGHHYAGHHWYRHHRWNGGHHDGHHDRNWYADNHRGGGHDGDRWKPDRRNTALPVKPERALARLPASESAGKPVRVATAPPRKAPDARTGATAGRATGAQAERDARGTTVRTPSASGRGSSASSGPVKPAKPAGQTTARAEDGGKRPATHPAGARPAQREPVKSPVKSSDYIRTLSPQRDQVDIRGTKYSTSSRSQVQTPAMRQAPQPVMRGPARDAETRSPQDARSASREVVRTVRAPSPPQVVRTERREAPLSRAPSPASRASSAASRAPSAESPSRAAPSPAHASGGGPSRGASADSGRSSSRDSGHSSSRSGGSSRSSGSHGSARQH